MCFLALLSGHFCWAAVLVFVAVALSGSWASVVIGGRVLGRELLQVSGVQKEMEMSEEGRMGGAVFAPRISDPR